MSAEVSFEINPLAIKEDWGFTHLIYHFNTIDDGPSLILYLPITEHYNNYLSSQIDVLTTYMMAEKTAESAKEVLKISGYKNVVYVLSWLNEDPHHKLKEQKITVLDQQLQYLKTFTDASFEINSLAVKPDWGFSRLKYSIANSRPRVILYLPIIEENNSILKQRTYRHEQYLQQPEVAPIYGVSEDQKTSKEIILTISGLRKVYHVLSWLKNDSNYYLKYSTTEIDQQIKYLEILIKQKPLPKYQFWNQKLQPIAYSHPIGKASTKIQVMRNSEGQMFFSKESLMGRKLEEHGQVSSIYLYFMLGEEVCLDWVQFDENHVRKRVNSLGIEDFQPMSFLKEQNRFPSFEEFIKGGEARHDVACYVNQEPDRNLSNFGIMKGGRIAKVDNGRLPWGLVSKYYGIPAKRPAYFNVEGFEIKGRPPADAFVYHAYDVQFLPFVKYTEFPHAAVNSLFSKCIPQQDLSSYFNGIQFHPNYIFEKFHYFLKAILYPDSFHQRVHEGFMSPTKHLGFYISYRKNSYSDVKKAVFACDDFWLYLHAYPQWINEIAISFYNANMKIDKYYGCEKLMNLTEVRSCYDEIMEQCADKLKVIVPNVIAEINFMIKIYRNFFDKSYRIFLKKLEIILEEFQSFLQQKSNTIPIRSLDEVKYEISSKELKEMNYCLLVDARLFFNQSGRQVFNSNNSPDAFDLLQCVFENDTHRVKLEIEKRGGLEDDKLIKETPSGLMAVELALACGHQEMVEILFLQEKKAARYSPIRYGAIWEVNGCVHEIRTKAKEHFLKLYQFSHDSTVGVHSSLFAHRDLTREMQSIFVLLRLLKKDFRDPPHFKNEIHTWTLRMKEARNQEFCRAVLDIAESTVPTSQSTHVRRQ